MLIYLSITHQYKYMYMYILVQLHYYLGALLCSMAPVEYILITKIIRKCIFGVLLSRRAAAYGVATI